MTKASVAIESPLSPDALTLINGSEAAIRAVYAADECFTFSPEELNKPNVSFFIARLNNIAMGCVALVEYEGYGEVKRLFVPQTARGHGIAKLLMAQLETRAKNAGLPIIRLETGPELAAAVALYKQTGYQIRGCFGNYQNHPASLFMEKYLS